MKMELKMELVDIITEIIVIFAKMVEILYVVTTVQDLSILLASKFNLNPSQKETGIARNACTLS